MNLKIEYIPVKDIVPYKNNAKLHPANCAKRAERRADEEWTRKRSF